MATRGISTKALSGFLAGSLLIVLWVTFALACSKTSSKTKHSDLRSEGSAPQALTIDSIPFGELKGKTEYNASGVIPLADSRFLICENNTNDALFELDLTPDGREKGSLIRRPLQGLAPDAVDDLESMTLVEEGGRRYVFLASSMYVKKAKKRSLDIPPSGVLRVTINPDDTLSAENLPGFREWLIKAYPQLAEAGETTPDDGGLNIEGLAWDKNRHALLFGLRSPVTGGKPQILPVKVKDLAGPWTTSNLEAQPPIQLSIESMGDEQGIRELSNVQGRDGFLVIVGKSLSDSTAPFALYEWGGSADVAPRRFSVVFAKKMKPEGITRGTIGGRSALVIVDDGGGFQVIWEDKPLPYARAF